MKNLFRRAFLAASLPLLAQTASAVVLLTDNFTVLPGGTNNQDVNQNLGNGRLGGSEAAGFIAGSNAYVLGPEHHQVGNTTTNVGQPDVADGNYVLVAFNGWFKASLDVASAAAGPLVIEFDMFKILSSTDDRWGAITLKALGSDGWPIVGANEFGMLNRANGGMQLFNATTPAGWDSLNFANDPHWKLTFTDTAGTGSAFAGNGSSVTFQNGSNVLGSVPYGQLASSGLQLGFRNLDGMFIGVDNLSISTVPEPTGAVLLSASLGLMAFRRRRA